MSYSRDLERQADKKALETLKDNDISARGLLEFFQRLDQKGKDTVGTKLQRLISTHPLSEERISYISEHIKTEQSEKNLTSALTDQEWRALKDICSATNES